MDDTDLGSISIFATREFVQEKAFFEGFVDLFASLGSHMIGVENNAEFLAGEMAGRPLADWILREICDSEPLTEKSVRRVKRQFPGAMTCIKDGQVDFAVEFCGLGIMLEVKQHPYKWSEDGISSSNLNATWECGVDQIDEIHPEDSMRYAGTSGNVSRMAICIMPCLIDSGYLDEYSLEHGDIESFHDDLINELSIEPDMHAIWSLPDGMQVEWNRFFSVVGVSFAAVVEEGP